MTEAPSSGRPTWSINLVNCKSSLPWWAQQVVYGAEYTDNLLDSPIFAPECEGVHCLPRCSVRRQTRTCTKGMPTAPVRRLTLCLADSVHG